MEGSSFDPIRSVVAFAMSAEVDWTGLGSLDTWFLYRSKTDEILDFPDGHTTDSLKRPLDGDIPLARTSFPALAVRLAIEQLLSMDEVLAKILGSYVAPGSASDVMGGDSRDDELTPYFDDDDGDGWDFADVPVVLTSMFVPFFSDTSTPFRD